jgi:hypothetical protein
VEPEETPYDDGAAGPFLPGGRGTGGIRVPRPGRDVQGPDIGVDDPVDGDVENQEEVAKELWMGYE